MGKIHELPENLVNLIAAGEVVERPASVLKELIENSIDAKSNQIVVHIEEAGSKLIEVKDNGVGMDEEDAVMAFKLHATSKINNEKDLSNISTLGFRGEALASIASVAGEIKVETKAEKNSSIKLTVKKSDIQKTNSKLTDNGTKISVINLFEHIPARKKFLKQEATEFKYLANTFIEIALANKDIHFELYHNNKLVYRLPKSSTIKERIFDIFGSELTKSLFDEFEVSSSNCKITFLLGRPEIAKKTTSGSYVFVNGRSIVSRLIQSACNEGYKGFIHRELKPVYFIFIHINPSDVDVNIHPRKLEVKFQNEQEIYRLIYSSIKHRLELSTREYITDNLAKQSRVSDNHQASDYPSFVKTNSSNEPTGFSFNNKNKKAKIEEALNFTHILLEPNKSVNTDNIQPQSLELDNIDNSNLFQLFNTYILVDKKDKLLVVDQHAACEKTLFEKLVKRYGKITTKILLTPQIFEFNLSDKQKILDKKEDLAKVGIIIDDFGPNSIQLSEIPEITDKLDPTDYFSEILEPSDDLTSEYSNYHEYSGIKLSKEIFILLATTACHASIRAGQALTADMMKKILKELLTLDNPYNCPHGRPTMWELSKVDIEKNFRRIL